MKKQFIIIAAVMGTAFAAQAANVVISNNVTSSETWFATNTYELANQVFVESGASLTIEAGTLIASGSALVEGGGLAVSRGGKLFVNGTKDNPVIMTSYDDPMNAWQSGANKWGNLTLMGKGLISAYQFKNNPVGANTPEPTGLNEKQMEGLVGGVETFYGGNNDEDDSGSISYLSIRYGGKVVGLGNELNGLSLGAIGRETDIHHVEIMNNVDDGIEIWGGAVNLRYVNIWNVGDDSFDVDQGWRGKAQFGLIVQGYSVDASQGSGLGDNCIEIDGAENSDGQPVTTTKIANFTVIGQPAAGDGATTWRDNARVQYHNCIFMNIGEEIVRFDCFDTDGGWGYGNGGTLTWEETWTTPYTYSATVAQPNAGTWTPGDFNDPAVMYKAQTSGNLAEIRGSLMYACVADADDLAFATGSKIATDSKGYAPGPITGNAVGAFGGDYLNPTNNYALDNIVSTSTPIALLERDWTGVSAGGKTVYMVTNINPVAVNDAASAAHNVAADDCMVGVSYRGAFGPSYNWLEGWTAVDAYGMTDTSMNSAVTPVAIKLEMIPGLYFQTDAGYVYFIQSADSLDGSWSDLASVVGDGSIKSVADFASMDDSKFYRAVVR